MTADDMIRVCLMSDCPGVSSYILKEIQTVVERQEVEITLFAIDESLDRRVVHPEREDDVGAEDGSHDSFELRLIPKFFTKLVKRGPATLIRAETRLAKILSEEPIPETESQQLKERIHIDTIDELSGVERMNFETEPYSEASIALPDETIDELCEKADVVILCGYSEILKGDILTRPEHGVLSFHGSDIAKYRGRPGQFFQFLNDQETIGLTLQRLTPDLDGGEIVHIKHADISDAKTWKEVRLRKNKLYGDMLATGFEKLRDRDFTPEPPDTLPELTFASDKNEWKNALHVVYKNMKGRYL